MTKSDTDTPEDLLPPGRLVPDYATAHYHYVWRAQYDDLQTGPWVDQFDAEGRERSVSWLDRSRTVRILLLPRVDLSRPTLEVHMNLDERETGTKHWQVDMVAGQPDLMVREVLSLAKPTGDTIYMVYDWEKNRVILATTQDH